MGALYLCLQILYICIAGPILLIKKLVADYRERKNRRPW